MVCGVFGWKDRKLCGKSRQRQWAVGKHNRRFRQNLPKTLWLKLAQASACAEGLTSVRWSQTDRFAKTVVNKTEYVKTFWAKIAQNAFQVSRLGVVPSFASFARDQRTLVKPSAQADACASCVLGKNRPKRCIDCRLLPPLPTLFFSSHIRLARVLPLVNCTNNFSGEVTNGPVLFTNQYKFVIASKSFRLN